VHDIRYPDMDRTNQTQSSVAARKLTTPVATLRRQLEGSGCLLGGELAFAFEGEHVFRPISPNITLGLHPMTLDQVKALCVSGFSGSARRELIFAGLTAFLKELSTAGVLGRVWIDEKLRH